jgi:ubiquitin
MGSNTLTPLEKARLELSYAHLYYYKNLLKYGPNLFEDDGDILLKGGEKDERMNGRDLILRTIKYYEEKDQPYFYRMCAKLKNVLDDYDAKYSSK